MSNQVKLPQEILKQVFTYLQPKDLLACLLVCYKWYVPAKHCFYTEIKFAQLSCIDPFIANVQSDPDHPNLLVKKITFSSEEYLDYSTFKAFREQFNQLIVLCPYIEKIACSDRLKNYVVEALHSLPAPLKCLGAFPYSAIPEYTTCTRLYSQTLKEYVMENFEARLTSTRADFGELANFPRLQKLFWKGTPARTLQEVEYVLNICRDLTDLSVVLFGKDLDDFDGVQEDAFYPRQANPQLQVQIQQYSKLKRLMFQSGEDVLDLQFLNPCLSKFNRLERLEIEAIDVLTAEGPSKQLEELSIFLDIIRTIPSVSFTVKSAELNKIYPVAFHYLQLFFQPDILWKHTSLKIYTVQGFYTKDSLHYTTSKAKHRELAIVLPAFETNNSSLHDAYVKTFAPYISTLEINYEYTRTDFNPCESFVYTVLSQCIALHSLTISYGSGLKPLSPTTNITLHTLDICRCRISSEFLESLSITCVNLRQLTLSPGISRKGIIDRIVMPQTKLKQLDLDLGQLKARLQAVILKITISKIERFFHVDFKKKWCIALKKGQLERYHAVELKFKRVKRLKILRLNETILDLE